MSIVDRLSESVPCDPRYEIDSTYDFTRIARRNHLRKQLDRVIGWHIDPDLDEGKSDHELTMSVINRYLHHRGLVLVDPNE